MNERIRQLADEAGLSEGVFTRHDGVPCDLKGYSMLPDEMKKFAQLIVQECGNWIVENAGAMEHLGPDYFAKAMTKDFGVELLGVEE